MYEQEYLISKGFEVKNRENAELLLLDVLNGILSSSDLLADLYGKTNVDSVERIIEPFIASTVMPLLSSGKKVRVLKDITKLDVYNKVIAAQSTDLFKSAEDRVNNWMIPEKKDMVLLFGVYSDFVEQNWKVFNELRKKRDCGMPFVIHLLRSATLAKEMGFDTNSAMPEKYNATMWSLHDSVEDLVYSIVDKKGRIVYGLENINDFLVDFIPRVMRQDIMMITNKSDLILKYMQTKDYHLNSFHEMDKGLSALQKNDRRYYDFNDDIGKMRLVLEKANLQSGRDSFLEDAKWEFYSKIFINNLAEQAYMRNHFSLLEGKLVLDLFDNYGTRHARKLDEKRRSLLKLAIGGSKAEEILDKMKFKGEEYSPMFEQKVNEIVNLANYGARELIMCYFAQSLSAMSHLRSGLKSIDKLKDVLYSNRING